MPTSHKILILGNGMASAKLLELLAEQPPQQPHEIQVIGAEPKVAYDRVHLSELFSGKTEEDLTIHSLGWYQKNKVSLHLNDAATSLDRESKQVTTASGKTFGYDQLVFATGSAPFVPPTPGLSGPAVFTYRDLVDVNAIKSYGATKMTAAVIGGGLLGLEAAKALQGLGLKSTVIEMAPRLMPRQLDDEGAGFLKDEIEALGINVKTSCRTQKVESLDSEELRFHFDGGETLDVDMIVVSCGIKPSDPVARSAGLTMATRGGIEVNHRMQTSDPDIFAIGEVASFQGFIQGLVAPAYQMARAAHGALTGGSANYEHPFSATKLKLLGVEVSSIGDSLGEQTETRSITLSNFAKGHYKKLLIDKATKKLVGALLVGDSTQFSKLKQLAELGQPLPDDPASLLVPVEESQQGTSLSFLPKSTIICNCENVTKGDLIEAITAHGITEISELKRITKAGTGCGGCVPMMVDLLSEQLEAQGIEQKTDLCEHFTYPRTELFSLIKQHHLTDYAQVLKQFGRGQGCEICKPTIANILASAWNLPVLNQQQIQDTNDAFLANIQNNGSYSVIPRMPGGEVTATQLAVIARVAEEFRLYVKLTGGERIALFGVHLNDLPKIWAILIDAGFESGHAYGKSLRTVKSCVGSTWCHLGVGDSLDMAITLEHRYKGLRGPHKIKGAASGCMRECAEAQSKDFGVIATERGWNLFVAGNGGIKPQHGQLLAQDITKEEVLSYIDRFLIYYFRTADRLTRTSTWISQLEGGINHLKDVVIHDTLGIAAELEEEMGRLIKGYHCEWKLALDTPETLNSFKTFLNSEETDRTIKFEPERGQIRPATLSQP